MKRWQCHKVVSAARILSITRTREDGARLLLLATEHLEPGSHDLVEVTPEWIDQRSAYAGGYYIVYDDGYTSYSPAPPFEAGYTPLTGAVKSTEEPTS